MRLEDVDTPALVLELDAFERNLGRMAAALAGRGVRLRPHAKTHKCPTIARRQLLAGAAGVCCQTVAEAEAMVDGGIADVLVTNEVVGAPKLERLAAIARAAQAAHQTRRLIESVGLRCPTVTGGGSGSFAYEIESGAYDEVQPGSYVFMDADYARNEWAAPLPRFEHALFVLSTVISRAAPRRAVLDAGLKASSVDSGLPLVWERPGLRYARASDEHGVLEMAEGAPAPELGEKLLLVPGHCDPTVNLYDRYVCVRHGVVEALWPIAARGAGS
ncbi:MAG: DSD1 family PLP-dependent enzyme [Betaproteobacteria bacterium]|nr:DSD1 family PLP-dependent enzyme [Betaproteobacteria bacterium]